MTDESPTSSDLAQRIRDSYDAYSATISTLPDDALMAPNTSGTWSVRDIIAHIGGDELWMAGQLEALRFETLPTEMSCYGIDTPVADGIDLSTQDGRNEWQHERLRALSLKDTRSMASEAHTRLLTIVASFPDEELTKPLTIAELKTAGWIRPPEAGEQAWPLWEWLRGVTYKHYAEHTEAIRSIDVLAASQKH